MQNRDASNLDYLSCFICLRPYQEPQSLKCGHSFCKTCLEEYQRDDSKIECPMCHSLTPKNDSKLDLHIQSLVDYVKKNDSDLSKCNVCDFELTPGDVQLCIKCSEIMCLDCCLHHKRAKKTKLHPVYSLTPRSKRICAEHKMKRTYYCQDSQCKALVCANCAIAHHNKHNLSSIEDQSEARFQEISQIMSENNNKLENIDNFISRFNQHRTTVSEKLSEIELLLKKRRDYIIQQVNECYQTQINIVSTEKTKIFEDIANNLEKLQSSRNMVLRLKKFGLYLKYTSDFDIVEIFNEINSISTRLSSLKLKDLDSISLSVMPNTFDKQSISKSIREWIGEVRPGIFNINEAELSIYSDVNYLDYRITEPFRIPSLFGPFVPFTRYYLNNVIYDSDNQVLYALKREDGVASVLKIFQNGELNVLNLDDELYPWHGQCLAIVKEGVLILCDCKKGKFLLLVSSDLTDSSHFKISFCDIDSLTLLCSSPCRRFLFFYSEKLNASFKFNLNTLSVTKSTTNLPQNTSYMTVHSNLDLIAFSGHQIDVFSFTRESVLYTVNGTAYAGMAFLTDNILCAAVIEYRYGIFQFFDYKRKQSIKRIPFEASRRSYHTKPTLDGPQFSMVEAISNSSLFVIDFNNGNGVIARVDFSTVDKPML